ncbi:glycosyltransferase [Pedobacter hartonius]|uniref:glycosyltransferase n=1 Tax=Pedobacter hartonius TaxID=425514 RepID=UPI0015876F05|nr:glycosyltransferase family 2 protein [Pedobacter hartonius]
MKILFYLVYFSRRIRPAQAEANPSSENLLSVDIIVPAYNEEKVILTTLDSLNEITYAGIQIIVVDDGSQDGTLALVKKRYGASPKFKIISQENKGKAFALNQGIRCSASDIVVCLDADTTVGADIIDKLVPYFHDFRVAAVAGTVKVRNDTGLICDMQLMEYLTSQNYEREVFESVNGILVIPGAIGAFRRNVLTSLDGYNNDTLTEDTDITLKILCNKYIVKNAADVFGYTEVPASIGAFLRQRVRWKVGTVQVLYKYHKQAMLSIHPAVSFIVIPYTWLYCIVLPFITPFVDYVFLVHLLFYPDFLLSGDYLLYILLDLAVPAFILFMRRDGSYQLVYLLFLRFLLRQVTFLSYIEICIRMCKGTLFEWRKSVRYGIPEDIKSNSGLV